jgi:RNA polymerase sigma factor (sigma-70 family)
MPMSTPDRRFLAAQIRWAMGRGLPAQAAEDVVFEAWEKADAGFDPRRGSFEAYMQRIVRNDCAYWWRRQQREQRSASQLRVLPPPDDGSTAERAAQNQARLLEALEPEERAIFAAWALQKHLGKGQLTSSDLSRSLGLPLSEYENAKRRLRGRLQRLLTRFGWSARDLLFGEDHVDRTG